MRLFWTTALFAVVLLPQALQSRQLEARSSLTIRGTLVTSSMVFDKPDAPVEQDRDHFNFVDNLLGVGIEYRLTLPGEDFYLTLSTEYCSKTNQNFSDVLKAPVEQGIRFVPLELGADGVIPLSGDNFAMTMGGGLGLYYVQRIYGIGGVRSVTQKAPIGFGIHIESGFEYRFLNAFRFRTELRFRDPEVINENRFDQDVITYKNTQIPVKNFNDSLGKSKIDVHGVAFSVSIVCDLN